MPVGTKERKLRQLEARELLVLDAARSLICENGLLKLQMSRIAEKCEYAVGTLYQHFAGKEDLLVDEYAIRDVIQGPDGHLYVATKDMDGIFRVDLAE